MWTKRRAAAMLARGVFGGVLGASLLAAAHAGAPGPVQPQPDTAAHADQLILQFKRAELRTALRQASEGGAARATVQRALDALGQRHGMALYYVQTLAVGSALVAVSPAAYPPGALDLRVRRLAADAEVASVEINARMMPFKPPPR